ncbi:MAG: type IX secretion system protein PorQ [Flavobacteriales bacterium]
MRQLFLTLIFSTALLNSFGQSIGGNSAFSFLNVPTSARASALGGQGIALADSDIQLASLNPALLDSNQHHQLALHYMNYFGSVNMGAATFVHHLDSSKVTLSGGIKYLDYGKFERLDAAGVSNGNFYVSDYVAQFGAAYPMDSLWTIGGQMQVIYNTFAQYNSLALALDASALYKNPKRNITAALTVSNLGYQVNTFTSDVRDSLPLNIQMSFTKTLRHAPFRFVVTADNLQQWDLTYNDPNNSVTVDPITGETSGGTKFEFGDRLMRHMILGGELLLSQNFQVRFGYNYRRRQELKVNSKPGTAGISFGLGMRIKRFNITYGRATYHLAGASNHFSIATAIGKS